MRLFSLTSTLKNNELDLLKTAAKCQAHKNAEVKKFYDSINEQIDKIKSMRRRAEDLEQKEAVAAALTEIADNERDKILLKIGAVLKINGPDSYESVFKKMPSVTARSSRDTESDEIKKIIERLKLLPQEKIEEYPHLLETAQSDFENVLKNYEDIKLKHSALRSEIENLKKEINTFRENLFADLIKITGKKEADLIL